MKCNKDCFNCLYPDCINDYVASYDAENHKKQRAKRKEEVSKKRKLLYEERKANGICVRCGKNPSVNGKTECIVCASKTKNRAMEKARKDGRLSRELFNGIDLCKKCGYARRF